MRDVIFPFGGGEPRKFYGRLFRRLSQDILTISGIEIVRWKEEDAEEHRMVRTRHGVKMERMDIEVPLTVISQSPSLPCTWSASM